MQISVVNMQSQACISVCVSNQNMELYILDVHKVFAIFLS